MSQEADIPERSPIEFDVSGDVALGVRTLISGTLFTPDTPLTPATIVVLLPGGGYTRRYYDLELEGYGDRSAAMQLARHGLVVVAIDNLGTGESTIPADGRDVTLDRCANAVSAFCAKLRERTRIGALHAHIDAGEPTIIGIGHSLGGCIITVAQGDHACCDAVGVLGFSCRYIKGAVDPETGRRLRQREPTGNGYNKTTPSHHRERFYSSEVPLDVILAEEAARVPMPDGVAEALDPGRSAPAAARISVPVLLAFGERDVSPEPHAEPAFYVNSSDVTLLMLAGAGHAHNSAPGRVAFWNRIANWIDMVRAR